MSQETKTISKLIHGHRMFRERFTKEEAFFRQLARNGQHPEILWVGCSDSRVIPEQITNAKPGDIFVIRNVANIVPPVYVPGDTVGAVIEYAVMHLHVLDIIICGHTECGGIKALEAGIDSVHEPHIAQWVEHARPAAYVQIKKSDTIKDMRHQETVKANILLQCRNTLTYSCVQDAVARDSLTIHGWLYDLHTGDLLAYDNKKEQWSSLA